MATQVQKRRGTTTEHSTFTGAVGELTVDTTKKTVVVHDGTTAGGHPLAKENDSRFTALVTPAAAGLTPATSFAAITYAATVNLDMAALDGQYRTITLSGGNLTFTTSNRAASRTATIRLIGDSSLRSLNFPAGWKFIGAKPTNLAIAKTAVLSVSFFGTADTDAVAAYGVEA